jgi:lipopolysaccharide export system protein LptA
MRFSIKRLRWVLLAGALLLIAVLAAFIGYGRYRAMALYTKLIKHSGATISHDTSGFTYSQTEKGKTIFTLHAARATQLGDGKWSLHDVAVTVYGRSEAKANTRTDYITGAEFTYDEKEGIVRAIGEVHMDLQAPQSLTASGRAGAPSGEAPPPAPVPASKSDSADGARSESADVVHVRTSGLVYLRKFGIAATDQPVEFHYHGIECTALGAEFNSNQSTIRLLADVVASGLMRDQPVTIHADSADIDRVANIATLVHTVAQSRGRIGSADLTTLDLRKDGSIESARATGHVTFTGKTQKITAPQLDATLTPQNVLHAAKLSGGVTLTDTNPLRPMQGSATEADIVLDDHGSPTNVTANGAAQNPVKLLLVDKRSTPRGLQRTLQGDRVVAFFAPAGKLKGSHSDSRLTQVHVTGSARARSESVAKPLRPSPLKQLEPQIKTTTIVADDLQLTFIPGADGKAQPQNLSASGHTLLQQDAPLGEQETSSGEKLDAVFGQSDANGKEGLVILSALQTGHVIVHRTAPLKPSPKAISGVPQQEIGSASADRASYNGATEKLTLSGNASLTQDNTSLTATSVVLNQRTQDADASGNVQATLENAPSSNAASTGARSPQYTHVLAAGAHFTHETRQAEFYGTDAAPARMWQAASQVQAAVLSLDGVRRTFNARSTARGQLIHAVLASTPAASSASGSPDKALSHGSVLRVASASMDYSDVQRQAAFTGPEGVLIQGDAGMIRAQRAVAYLAPATQPAAVKPVVFGTNPTPFNGSLDHVVITGEVQLDQPGRHGTGDQLVYTAATGNSVLTGSPSRPPHIVDAQQGSVTGASLLFGDAGSTIVVSGEADAAKPSRVHTETHLQNRK